MVQRTDRHTPFYELLEAQGQAGCPICRLARRRTARYLDSLLYEAVLDGEVRRKLKASHGFCREHVAMLHDHPGRSLGIALIYETVLRHVIDLTEQGKLQPGSLRERLRGRAATGTALADELSPEQPCPACDVKADAEQSYCSLLTSSLGDADLYSAYAAGEGLCLPHLALALEQVTDQEALERLIQPQLARYRTMLAELGEYIRKCDHRFAGEPLGEEGDVWLRAMNAMAGGAGMGLSARHGGRRSHDE